MLSDVAAILVAFVLWPLAVVTPGYAATLLLNPLDAKIRSTAHRLLIALPLSLAVAPLLLYLLWTFAGIQAALGALALCAAVSLPHLASRAFELRGSISRHRYILIASLIWIGMAFLTLLPIHSGGRLFLSVVYDDYSKHIAVTDAITRTGLPPAQPYFAPGHGVAMHYYFGWFIQCSLIDCLAGSRVGPEHAVAAGTIWTGLSLFACLLALAKHLGGQGDARAHYRWVAVLLLVSGVDVIPILVRNLYFWAMNSPEYSRSVEWWNEQVSAWLDMMLWVPHHVGAATAGMISLLLVRRSADGAIRWGHAALAAIGFASCVLMSVYVAMALTASALGWVIACLLQRRRLEAAALAVSGALALAMSLPFLLELAQSRADAHSPLGLGVRPFWPVRSVVIRLAGDSPMVEPLLNLAALPLNYAMELGFYALAAWICLAQRRREPAANTDHHFAVVVSIGCLLVATFVRATMQFNDVGWRTLIPAQAMLLLAGASLMTRVHTLSFIYRKGLWLLLGLGIATTGLDMALLRFSAIYDHARGYTNDLSQAAFDLRDVHRWIDSHTPRSAVILHNPRTDRGALQGNFCRRQRAVADEQYGPLLGGSRDAFQSLHQQVAGLFSKPRLDEQSLRLIRDTRVDLLLIDEDDGLWAGFADADSAPVVYRNRSQAVVDVHRLPDYSP